MKNSVDNLGTAPGADVGKPVETFAFAPGDLVQLRSGGPVMTFCQAQSYGVEVAFMSRDGMQRTFVPVATLMPYKRRLYESDEAPMPPQQPPQQQSDQPKDERLDAILRASERKASALERIAVAIEKIAGCVGPSRDRFRSKL